MSEQSGLAGVPAGPPWPVDVVADVHAGLYPPELNRQLRERMMADPQASATLTALNAVTDRLSLLPGLTMPDRYATRLSAAIDAEAQARAAGSRGTVPTRRIRPTVLRTDLSPLLDASPTWNDATTRVAPGHKPPGAVAFVPPIPTPRSAPETVSEQTQRLAEPTRHPSALPPPGGDVIDLDAGRRRRRLRATAILGLAAAVALIGVVTFVATRTNSTGSPNSAGGASPSAIATASLPANAAQFKVDPSDVGGVYVKVKGQTYPTDPIVWADCLAANGLSGKDLLGASVVSYRGSDAIALAVAIDSTHAEVLIVAPLCGGPLGAQLLTKATVSR